MKITNEMIEKLKEITMPYGMLAKADPVLADALVSMGHTGSVQYYSTSGWLTTTYASWAKWFAYRLHPEYKAETPYGWVEHDIVEFNGEWRIPSLTDDIGGDLYLSEITDVVGFGGVQFEGQKCKGEWYMYLSAYINKYGDVHVYSEVDYMPATPIKCRILTKK